MPAGRLLSILLMLQTRGRVSATALSSAFGVSVRTIYRDIDQLSASGVPVYGERGAAGGFALVDGWRTRLTGLTASEAQALFLCGLPGPAAQLGMGEAVASAQLKLLAALPADWLAEARRVSSRFHVDPLGWYRDATPAPMLGTISDAVWHSRRLRIRYDSWKGVVSRTVEPLGLVLKSGDWYFAGRVRESVRTFRVSNVLAATSVAGTFQPPKAFDLGTFWEQSLRRFEKELYVGTATVLASPRGAKLLRESSRAVAEALDRGGGHATHDGRLRVTIPIESLDQATSQMLRFGTEVEVLEPPALREGISRAASAIASLHAAPASAEPVPGSSRVDTAASVGPMRRSARPGRRRRGTGDRAVARTE